MSDSFSARGTLEVGSQSYTMYRLSALENDYQVSRLPYSMKILLENLLRNENGKDVTAEDIKAVAQWDAKAEQTQEIAFTPSRVILQDFTGVPAIVDLAAMRDAMQALGGDPDKINPLSPAELVIDHSVMVDHFASDDALDLNAKIEFDRNKERYAFLRWGQGAFSNFKVVPPDTGIVHQVNLEYLARVIFDRDGVAYPDTVVGTDSHTTMINGVGVLGWGVGGIEAEAAMLGQPITMLIPQVVGFKLSGKLPEGTTATDLVLTVTEMLRAKGVVGKFVEFFGDGLAELPLADRATIANMAPEYGATCGIFPVDGETIRYLELTGRDAEQIARVEAYAKEQGMWRIDGEPDPEYTDVLELDMSTVQPSLAGPKRPQDRVLLKDMATLYQKEVGKFVDEREAKSGEVARLESEGGGGVAVCSDTKPGEATVSYNGQEFTLKDGSVVIAAITSCTNTSNPAVLIAAGLLARNARAKGLTVKPWVKTSLAPGSKVVTDYLIKAGLMDDLEALGFHVVGYGCTTCIGNSGPLPDEISKAINEHDLVATSVLSGNRNFEGRVHADVRMNFLASPPLVVAYALAGSVVDSLVERPIGQDADGNDVFLKDVWPSQKEIQELIGTSLSSEMFKSSYGSVFEGDARWKGMETPEGNRFDWQDDSTYVQNPPYFVDMDPEPEDIKPIRGARCLALLGDSITTDHISPAGNIAADSPAGQYLQSKGVKPVDFNSYGSRRGNHEVMMRGTFANIRLRNQLAPGTEGGWTRFQPDDEEMTIYDAAMKYQDNGTPLVVLAGKEYGTGSSRDWAAKGTQLLGVKAVIAQSFERIHRSNLVGFGVLPLCFKDGDDIESLGLSGKETFEIEGLEEGAKFVTVKATSDDGEEKTFEAKVRIDTPKEWDYYRNGGILHYVLRELAAAA
ncbi:MAG: aconitate hydratase AcnA [Nevskiales bacterium]|nr:aconitate hydratase AcnA [Nevskiales bacterium]